MKQLALEKSESLSLMPAMGSFDAVGSSRQSISKKTQAKAMVVLLVVPESLATTTDPLKTFRVMRTLSTILFALLSGQVQL